MSPLPWRERAAVWLAPSQVGLALRRRGWRPPERHQQAVAAGGADAVLQALAALAAQAGPRRARARIVLSNRFVRSTLLPDGRALRGPAERRVAARELLRGVHGDAVEGWDLAVDGAAGPGMPAAALDAGWLARLRQQALQAGLRAVSVRPLLALAAAHAWPQLAGRPSWLLVTEADGALLARIDPAQGWQSLRSLPLDAAQGPAALAPWLARCALLDGLEPAGLPLVHVAWQGMAAAGPFAPPDLPGWQAEHLALTGDGI
ncbi:MAG: hypothetical protein QM777_12775 [Pseudorhodoferax sp.]